MSPIMASQNQEENVNEEEAFQRKKKVSIVITIMSSMIFLGLLYYSGGFGYSIPTIYIFIIIIGLIRVISISSRSRSRGRSQNYPQRERSEPIHSEYQPTTIKRNQNFCLQCGSKIDRKDIDCVSVYYCSHCGNEIKNDRV